MKVYELMKELAELPSGAEVVCSVTLTANELESCDYISEDDNGKTIYTVSKKLDCIISDDNQVYLDF